MPGYIGSVAAAMTYALALVGMSELVNLPLESAEPSPIRCMESAHASDSELHIEVLRRGTRTDLAERGYVKYAPQARLIVTVMREGKKRKITKSVKFRSLGIVNVDDHGNLSGLNLSDWRFTDPDSLEELGPIEVWHGSDLVACVSVV